MTYGSRIAIFNEKYGDVDKHMRCGLRQRQEDVPIQRVGDKGEACV